MNKLRVEKHYGEIVERVVRKKGVSMTELAKELNVNRRSLYNWFRMKYLKASHIQDIGLAIKHDFSQELPELFHTEPFTNLAGGGHQDNPRPEEYKDKYINLLEQYNALLEN